MFKHSLSFKHEKDKEKRLKESLDISIKTYIKTTSHFSEYSHNITS